MNYESVSFHHGWISLPDVQIMLRETTTTQAEVLESQFIIQFAWTYKWANETNNALMSHATFSKGTYC